MNKHTQKFGTMRYEIDGIEKNFVGDLYHTLMRSSWARVLSATFFLYVATSFIFAVLLAIGEGNVVGAKGPLDLFWFSVQSLSTIGYGNMHPETPWAHFLVLIESFLGMVETAIIMAVLFAKFSLPKARVAFAEHAILLESQGEQYLQIRLANARGYPVVNAKITLSALITRQDMYGVPMRQMIELPLLQTEIPLFGLSFTATHCLSSGIFANMTLEEMHKNLFLLVISFKGVDEILEQEVRDQNFYRPEYIIEHVRYKDMVNLYDWGATMNLNDLSSFVPEDKEKAVDSILLQMEPKP